MNSLIFWILTVPFAAVIVIFALYNRHEISLHINPLDVDAAIIPAYIFGAGAALVGFFWGSVMTWLGYSCNRSMIKAQKKTIKNLEKEIKVANENIKTEKMDNKLLIGK